MYPIKILVAAFLLGLFMVIAGSISASINPAPEVSADVPCVASLPPGIFTDWPLGILPIILILAGAFLIGDVIWRAIKTVRWVQKQMNDDKD